uniref:LicD/FKTN/FKRP nucleotidyltransferase domain-containing protein n=1 Tax=viral metagenome TaxID=1070528 RepID=A0A6C0ELJ0_9ZZZZ
MRYILVIVLVIVALVFIRLVPVVYGYYQPLHLEGIRIPRYVTSDHQKLPVGSKELIAYMNEELYTMKRFHDYCMANNIFYTLVAGSLMSCLTVKTYFPWDDDLDLVVRESDWPKIVDLWNRGRNQREIKDKRWLARDTRIGEETFVILLNKANNGWIKLLNQYRPELPDVGGLDIGYAFLRDGKLYESMNRKKEAPGTYSFSDVQLYPFAHITVMAVSSKHGFDYLNRIYTGWDIYNHPDYNKGILSIMKQKLF